MIILQDNINELRVKVNILQEANKNAALFQKHFHKITQSKSDLEDLLNKHEKYAKQGFYQKESGIEIELFTCEAYLVIRSEISTTVLWNLSYELYSTTYN